MWRLLFFLAFNIVLSNTTTFLEFQDVEDGNIPSCIDKNGKIRALGESWQLEGECVSSRCLTVNATKSLIMHYKCPNITVKPESGCKVILSLNTPHPKCCSQLNCP